MKIIDPDGSRVRRHCVLCDKRCAFFCTGCKQILCFSAPRDRKIREKVKVEAEGESQVKTVWKKVPRNFYVDVPHLDDNGKVKISSNGPVYSRLYGEATCFHIAHQEAWKRHLHEQQAELVTQIAEATKEAEKKARKKKKKKKSKKAKRD